MESGRRDARRHIPTPVFEYSQVSWQANHQLNTPPDLVDTIIEGAVIRVRPRAMTVAVINADLIPIMPGQGTGHEIMQRIAARWQAACWQHRYSPCL